MSTDHTVIGVAVAVVLKGIFDAARERRRDKRRDVAKQQERVQALKDLESTRNDVLAKIAENTKINTKAINVANHANMKIADVAERADRNAATSLADVRREIAEVRKLLHDTRQILAIRALEN